MSPHHRGDARSETQGAKARVLYLNLFGTGQLSYGERTLPGFPRHRPHLLMCYLALYHDQAHSREHLAAVFWGDRSTPDSRKYLRNALWRLRQGLQSIQAPDEDYLCVANDTVSLCGQEHLWLDTRAFEERVTCCQHIPGPELTAEQAAGLEFAVHLYTGDLLQNTYDDWCIYERRSRAAPFLYPRREFPGEPDAGKPPVRFDEVGIGRNIRHADRKPQRGNPLIEVCRSLNTVPYSSTLTVRRGGDTWLR